MLLKMTKSKKILISISSDGKHILYNLPKKDKMSFHTQDSMATNKDIIRVDSSKAYGSSLDSLNVFGRHGDSLKGQDFGSITDGIDYALIKRTRRKQIIKEKDAVKKNYGKIGHFFVV